MNFEASIDSSNLTKYILNQCDSFFPDHNRIDFSQLFKSVELVFQKIKYCFRFVNLPYYKKNGIPYFNHLNGDHYCIFLCYLTRTVFLETQNESWASKIFLLNKALFGIDAFYGIELPKIFIVVHPIGSIIGRAHFMDRLVIYQGVTIGATAEGIYPKFSENTILYSNSSIIGKCEIGKNFVIGANSTLLNSNIPDNSSVVGNFPNHKIMEGKKLISHYFNFSNES